MSVNDDSVLRSVSYQIVHPKEVCVAGGIPAPEIPIKKNLVTSGGFRKNSAIKINMKSSQNEELPSVYPYVALLTYRCVHYYHVWTLHCTTWCFCEYYLTHVKVSSLTLTSFFSYPSPPPPSLPFMSSSFISSSPLFHTRSVQPVTYYHQGPYPTPWADLLRP